MRYYSILRPVSIGTYPRSGVMEIKNFNRREYVPEIGREAWGYIDYSRKLTEKEAASYELVATGTEKPIDKRQLIDFMVNAGMGKREIGEILRAISAGGLTAQEVYGKFCGLREDAK